MSKHATDPRLLVRQLTAADYPAVAQIQRECFPNIAPWAEDQFLTHLQVFPEGQLGIELDGTLVATSSAVIVDSVEFGRNHTYERASGEGYLTNHDPEGDTLYGLDIAVLPHKRGKRLARRLYDARKAIVKDRELRSFVIAGRMPRYHKHPELSPEDYVRNVLQKKLRDRVITAQVANGFQVRAVLHDYLPSDLESCGHAVLMEWRNPDYVPDVAHGLGTGRVRVAVAQMWMRSVGSWEEFATQCEFFIDTAGDYQADFLLFPELLTNPLLALVPARSPADSARRLHEFTDRYVAFFSAKALEYNVNIVAGSHLVVGADDHLYNKAFLFRRDGSVDEQTKLHITPAEARWWGVSAGDRLRVFDTDRGPIAILICYDVEFPELARVAASRGARLLFVPYNTDLRQGHLRVRYCAHARCIENHMYAVLAGAVGNIPSVEGADIHYGQGAILTPSDVGFARDGIEAEATPNTEAMLIHDLDLDVLRRTRRTGTVRPWFDRRTDLYRVRFEDPDGETIV